MDISNYLNVKKGLFNCSSLLCCFFFQKENELLMPQKVLKFPAISIKHKCCLPKYVR